MPPPNIDLGAVTRNVADALFDANLARELLDPCPNRQPPLSSERVASRGFGPTHAQNPLHDPTLGQPIAAMGRMLETGRRDNPPGEMARREALAAVLAASARCELVEAYYAVDYLRTVHMTPVELRAARREVEAAVFMPIGSSAASYGAYVAVIKPAAASLAAFGGVMAAAQLTGGIVFVAAAVKCAARAVVHHRENTNERDGLFAPSRLERDLYILRRIRTAPLGEKWRDNLCPMRCIPVG